MLDNLKFLYTYFQMFYTECVCVWGGGGRGCESHETLDFEAKIMNHSFVSMPPIHGGGPGVAG